MHKESLRKKLLTIKKFFTILLLIGIICNMERNTKQREIIKQAIDELYGCHPSAEAVYEKVHSIAPQISAATVYRNLAAMSEAGIIRRLHGSCRKAFYDQNTANHPHFICNKCGKVFDIPCAIAEDFVNKAIRLFKCSISSCEITAHGICEKCNYKEIKEK